MTIDTEFRWLMMTMVVGIIMSSAILAAGNAMRSPWTACAERVELTPFCKAMLERTK